MVKTSGSTSEDQLAQLFSRQKELMEKCGVNFPADEPTDWEVWEAVSGMVVEGSEALDELRRLGRPWMPKLGKRGIVNRIIEETVDVLFFVLETLILLGVSPERAFNCYMHKHAKNLRRIEAKSK